jgi:hypothetical protein
MAELEQRYVARLVDAHGGHITRAAAAAGITRRQLQRLRARAAGRDDDGDDDA